MDDTIKQKTVVNGFKRCGLCPWNPEAVDYTKVDILNPEATPKNKPCKNSENNFEKQPTNSKSKQFVDVLETFIHPSTLQKFKETYAKFTPVWMGEEKSQDLYVVWKRATDKLKNLGNLPDVTIETVRPDELTFNETEILRRTTPEKIPQ